MYKRHFISASICLLTFIVGSQIASAQSQLAQDTYAIFEASCLNCHGADGAYQETLLMEHSALINGGTALHPYYPNPFNPETSIPYQLAVPAEVALTIFDMNGGTIRRLEMGHQSARNYQSHSRAAYWDGLNGHGESVASSIYFYTLRTGEIAGTRKMLIRK